MATYTEQSQQIANRYIQETGAATFTAREIGAWANRAAGERVNLGIWRDIEGRFRALRKEYGDGLVANWISTFWNDRGEQWYLSGSTNDREREVFAWLVERATVELGHPGGNTALTYWLDLLKTESPNFRSGTTLTHVNKDGIISESQAGTIYRLIEASADYCLKLETKDIIKVRSPGRDRERDTVQDQKRQESLQRPANDSHDERANQEGDLPRADHGPSDKTKLSAEVGSQRKKRGRPAVIPDDRKRQALRAKGGKARAQILYNTKYPTPQQIKNVRSILRHFEKTHQPSE